MRPIPGCVCKGGESDMNNFVQTMKPRIRSARESMYLLARNKLSLAALIRLLLLAAAAAWFFLKG